MLGRLQRTDKLQLRSQSDLVTVAVLALPSGKGHVVEVKQDPEGYHLTIHKGTAKVSTKLVGKVTSLQVIGTVHNLCDNLR